MGERTQIAIGLIIVLAVFGIMGAACTREKPAPTASPVWVPPTTRLTTPGPTAGATVISVEEKPTAPVTTPAPTGMAVTPMPPSPTPSRVFQPPTPTPVPTSAPTVPPTPVLPTPAPIAPTFTYIVRPGDTLYSIARRYGTSVDVLVNLNNLSSADNIKVGQELQIPGTAPVPAPRVHIVRRGDTLYSIARYYGVSMTELVAINGIANPDRIYIGQRLVIPGLGVRPIAAPRTHIVQKGETLLEIALRYGVTMQALQAANNISDPDHIEVGQVLVIP